jgi:hypothetical protein
VIHVRMDKEQLSARSRLKSLEPVAAERALD